MPKHKKISKNKTRTINYQRSNSVKAAIGWIILFFSIASAALFANFLRPKYVTDSSNKLKGVEDKDDPYTLVIVDTDPLALSRAYIAIKSPPLDQRSLFFASISPNIPLKLKDSARLHCKDNCYPLFNQRASNEMNEVLNILRLQQAIFLTSDDLEATLRALVELYQPLTDNFTISLSANATEVIKKIRNSQKIGNTFVDVIQTLPDPEDFILSQLPAILKKIVRLSETDMSLDYSLTTLERLTCQYGKIVKTPKGMVSWHSYFETAISAVKNVKKPVIFIQSQGRLQQLHIAFQQMCETDTDCDKIIIDSNIK